MLTTRWAKDMLPLILSHRITRCHITRFLNRNLGYEDYDDWSAIEETLRTVQPTCLPEDFESGVQTLMSVRWTPTGALRRDSARSQPRAGLITTRAAMILLCAEEIRYVGYHEPTEGYFTPIWRVCSGSWCFEYVYTPWQSGNFFDIFSVCAHGRFVPGRPPRTIRGRVPTLPLDRCDADDLTTFYTAAQSAESADSTGGTARTA